MLAQGQYKEFSEIMKLVRHADLRMVDKCDFVLAYIDLDVYAVGTWEEIFWANRLMRPVILVCKQGKICVPEWCWGALKSEMFFNNFEEALNYIKYVDSADSPETFNRWIFFKVAPQQGI